MRKLLAVGVFLAILAFYLPCLAQQQAQVSTAELEHRLEKAQLEMRAINAEYIVLQAQLEAKQKRFNVLQRQVAIDTQILKERKGTVAAPAPATVPSTVQTPGDLTAAP